MKSLLLLPALLYLSEATGAWRFVSKVEELPVEITDRLEIMRPKVRMCGGDSDSEESTDCVLCTVCHPHEYELIGCSGQMDAVCASCTTGWMRSTPKTTDFFRKCKKHPQLPFLFPDLPYPVRLNAEPSLFAQQEKMLQHAEKEIAEMDDSLSEEDYEDEDEDEEWRDNKEEDESKEIGVKPVDVDERDDGYEDSEEFLREEEEQKKSDESIEIVQKEDLILDSEEDKSTEVKDEERADPFDSKQGKESTNEEEDDEDSEETLRLYPLHRANIWRIIGPELAPIDDKDIAKEVRNAINDRMEARQMAILRRKLNEESESILEMRRLNEESKKILAIAHQNRENGQPLIGGYRPLLVRNGGSVQYSLIERINRVPLVVCVAWILCFSLSSLVLVVMLKMCLNRRRNRVIILPEMDDMSRQLINEAHARVHSKKDKKIRPEFV